MKKLSSIIYKLIFLTIFCSTLNADDKVTLQLSWLHQFQFAGYYMAKEKGFYKKAGIDVDIKEYQFGLDLSTVIEEGKADFAVGRSSLIVDKFNGKDVVALASIYQKSPLMLLVKKDSQINTISDLKNKKIMITNDAKTSASIIAMLNSNGISLDDVEIQNHTFNINDLIDEKTDAMASYISNEPIILQEKGIKYNIFNPKDFGFQFYDDILFTSSKFINNNPKLTKSFLEATLKGWEYAFENKVETAELIFNKYNTQKRTKIQLIKEGEALKKLIFSEKDRKIGCIDKNILKDIVNTYKVLGLITNNIDLNSFIYEHNPHLEYKLQLTNIDLIVILVALFLLLISIISIILYISIKSKLLHTNASLDAEIEKSKKNQQILLQHSKISSISKLLQNISHQWRQPLSVVSMSLSNIAILIEMEQELNKKEIKETIDISMKKLNYISRIIDDFATYVNSDQNLDEITSTETVMNKFKNLIENDCNKKGGILVDNIENISIKYDSKLLIQALINIYDNSIDAFDNIDAQKENRYLFLDVYEKNENDVIIKFKDSAGGISENILGTLFEPYTTTKHEYIGTGLDLYITYHIIVDLFGGEISANNVSFTYDNKDLKGAEFTICLKKYEN